MLIYKGKLRFFFLRVPCQRTFRSRHLRFWSDAKLVILGGCHPGEGRDGYPLPVELNIYLYSQSFRFTMRYVALFFVVILLLMAYLQLNDPDPIWWVTLYLIPTFISFRAFRNKYSLETLIILSILYLAYAMNSCMQITAYEGFVNEGGDFSMKTNNQELAREASGLGICVIIYVTYIIYGLVKKK